MDTSEIIDPLKFGRKCWPDIRFYKEQQRIIYSVAENEETYVPAGNALGKDFVSAFIALWFFCSRSPARVVTTSVKFDQLNDVLWGEIRRFLDTCEMDLRLHYNHMKIRQLRDDGTYVPLTELVGQVINKGESLLGRHLPKDIPRTLAIFDEASGIDDMVYDSSDTWAHKKLIIGNPYPCTNFFRRGVKGGNVRAVSNKHLFRAVIRIKAEHSPNVRLAQAEIRKGRKPSNTVLVPGVKDYATYLQHRAVWDPVRQCIGLDAEFYEGVETLLYPPEWLNMAEQIAVELKGKPRRAKTMGHDSGEGQANSAWAIIDELGLIKLRSMKTPDTSVIPPETIALMHEFNVRPEDVYLDRGGGGKQHADALRKLGYNVNTVAFGESTKPARTTGITPMEERELQDEERYVYKNRRAQMYGMLSLTLDPGYSEQPFALPAEYTELRRQLAPIPRWLDEEGRLYLPPKQRKPTDTVQSKVTMFDLLGCSPDDADALVLAVYGLQRKPVYTTVQIG